MASVPVQADILFIEHTEFGIEQFKVSEASWNLYQSEDKVWEFVIRVSNSKAIQRSKELEDIVHAKPNFEATAVLSDGNLNLSSKRVIIQKEGYDYDRGENLSNIYYSAHNSIEDLRIELIEVTDGWIDAKVTGRAIINGSNGNHPDAKISLRTKFKQDKDLKRSFY